MTLYAQLVGATSAQSFYLDDVVITETAPPPGGTPIATYTFADGGLDGWTPFGSATLTNAAPPVLDPNGDALSLLTTNRTASYMGPSLNLLSVPNVVAGATYQVSAYVLLAAPDSSNPTVTISTKTADCATSGAFGNIATSGALSSTVWTKVQGTFSFSNLPGPPTSLTLYFQSSSATDSFYISDVMISELVAGAAEPEPAGQLGNHHHLRGWRPGWLEFAHGQFHGDQLDRRSRHSGDAQPADYGTRRELRRTADQCEQQDVCRLGVQHQRVGDAAADGRLEPRHQHEPADHARRQYELSEHDRLSGNYCAGGRELAPDQRHRLQHGERYDPGAAFLYFQTVPASGNDLVSFYIDDFQLTLRSAADDSDEYSFDLQDASPISSRSARRSIRPTFPGRMRSC